MTERRIDWANYLNRLVYCYGCGRFGVPRGRTPQGWKVLYQPHGDAPAGLLVCGSQCETSVREAMAQGPVLEPLKIGTAPMMPSDIREAMEEDVMEQIKANAPTFGQLIRAARMNKGLSRVQIEESAEGITAQLIADVEEGRRPLDGIQCATLAALLDIDPERLVEAAQQFHATFWQQQGVQPETEFKVGHALPTVADLARYGDEIVRLRSDLKDGLALMRGIQGLIKEDERFAKFATEAWVARAEAAVKRAEKVLGVQERPEEWFPQGS